MQLEKSLALTKNVLSGGFIDDAARNGDDGCAVNAAPSGVTQSCLHPARQSAALHARPQ